MPLRQQLFADTQQTAASPESNLEREGATKRTQIRSLHRKWGFFMATCAPNEHQKQPPKQSFRTEKALKHGRRFARTRYSNSSSGALQIYTHSWLIFLELLRSLDCAKDGHAEAMAQLVHQGLTTLPKTAWKTSPKGNFTQKNRASPSKKMKC